MSKLDDAIGSVAYILDCLRDYRVIVESGDCNACRRKKECGYCPKAGQLVRYNCPFFERRVKDERAD